MPIFKHLLSPGRIGQMELRNRIVMAPMGTYLAARDGTITDRLKAYYEERAKGGAAMVIVEVAAVDHPRGRGMTRQIGISDDKFIPGLSGLAESIHRHGAKISIQLHHARRIAAPFLSGGFEAVAPSVIPLIPKELGNTRELTVPEITQLVQCYAQAAGHAQKAGFDGVEIHAGHGYLISEFLSRSANHRQDDYGGDLKNRTRFLMEIIQAIRQVVGPAYPVWCRMDSREFSIENGITQGDALETARMAEKAGLDALHVTGYGGSEGVHFTDAPLVYEPGFLLPLAREIKRAVKIPVIAVGRISPEMAETVLEEGGADFIAMGRPLIADPELPHKLASGNPEDIRKCIYCYTCVHQIFVRNNVCCAINASTGKESEPAPKAPEKVKKVLVVGGGPAGLEAARVAALRGHKVTLIEKERRLGGSLLFASIVRPENADLIDYLLRQIKQLKVEVRLGETFTPAFLDQFKPDAVVLAVGALRHTPPLPTTNRRNVINGDDLRIMLNGPITPSIAQKLTFTQKLALYPGLALFGPFLTPSRIRQITRFWMPLGKQVVILGGGLVGCELAVFLAERGRKVTILENSEQLAPEMAVPMKWKVLDQLDRLKVAVLTEVKYEEINSLGMVITEKSGAKKSIEADTVIVAFGTEPDKDALTALQGKVPEVYLAGDCAKLSFIKDSIAEASRVASLI